MGPIEISQKVLCESKCGNDFHSYKEQLKELSLDELLRSLETDNQKKTFWINIYNSFATDLLRPNPEIILNPLKRKQFFNKKQIEIAGLFFSLNDVEHQFLRKSRIWWSKGYLKKWVVNDVEKQLRVESLDPRIHFALNCGGLGCPPIRFYEVENIEDQLDVATHAFLFSEAKKDSNQGIVKVSKLFNWYIGDFGGKSGMLDFLKKYEIINPSDNPEIVYNDYNWEPWIKKTTNHMQDKHVV